MAINIDQDTQQSAEGVWTDYRGSKFKVGHVGSPKFQRTLVKLQAPHRRSIERGNMDPIESRNLLCKAMAQSLVLDWDNVVDSSGSAVKFDVKSCELALINNQDLREYLQEFCLDLENFRHDEITEMGNV